MLLPLPYPYDNSLRDSGDAVRSVPAGVSTKWCRWSVDLDDTPGDRAADCHGGTEPIAIQDRSDGEWLLVHHCKTCFVVHVNRVAGDDSERELLALAVRPLRHAPFPI